MKDYLHCNKQCQWLSPKVSRSVMSVDHYIGHFLKNMFLSFSYFIFFFFQSFPFYGLILHHFNRQQILKVASINEDITDLVLGSALSVKKYFFHSQIVSSSWRTLRWWFFFNSMLNAIYF